MRERDTRVESLNRPWLRAKTNGKQTQNSGEKKDKFVVPFKAGDGQIQGSGSDSLLRMGFAPASSLHRKAPISWGLDLELREDGSELELSLTNNR